jgi:LPS O-antigen subunit length determinant protein (WzzB/FepE family)
MDKMATKTGDGDRWIPAMETDGYRRWTERNGMTMHLDLTDEQASDLQDLLRSSLSDLSTEIAATDNAAYRDGLRSKRKSLETVLALLESPKT